MVYWIIGIPNLNRKAITPLLVYLKVTTKFGLLGRLGFKALGKLFDLQAVSQTMAAISGGGKKPNPAFEYIEVTLDSLKLDFPTQSISFFLETHLSRDCEMCVLERFQGIILAQ